MAVEKTGQDKSKQRKVTCKNCGAKLSYYPKDVKTQSVTSMCESEVISWIVCPQCKAHVTVK